LPFFRCRFAVAVSRCRFRTPLPLPLRIFLLFTDVTEREFSYVILQINGLLQRQNGETATEERQRNGENRASGGTADLKLKPCTQYSMARG